MNDLAVELNKFKLGIKIGKTFYMQMMLLYLSKMETTCKRCYALLMTGVKKWKFNINSSKTKIVHLRKLTDRDYHVGEHYINVVIHINTLVFYLMSI